MDYKLAKRLKKAGFPQGRGEYAYDPDNERDNAYLPTLDELIEACGDEFSALHQNFGGAVEGDWQALAWVREGEDEPREGVGEFRVEAVAELWLKLQEK